MLDFSLLQDFHFVRPLWLIALIPAWLLGWLLRYRQQWRSSWQHFIDPVLLTPLLKGKINKPGNTFPLLVTLFWTTATLALAGPAWQKLPQPVKKIDNALVILLDLSPSMLAADVKPARLVAARHKIIDLLNARQEGYTALVAYSGDAHVVAPLTDDNETIVNLVNVLEPAIMPINGSNLERAIEKALELFENSGYTNGDILLITDGITEQARDNSSAILSNSDFRLSIIGVGTEAGAPIPSHRGGFIKDDKGNIIMPALNSMVLQNFANDVNGSYITLQLSDKDILPLIKGHQRLDQEKTTSVEREFDEWQDMGALLTWPLLFLILLAYRRGIILGLIAIIPLLHTNSAEADDGFLAKLWSNDNQRAMKALERKDYETASKLFNDPEWKAYSQYMESDYEDATIGFSKKPSPNSLYNKGNALAKSGHYQEAIDSYKEAIKLKPDFEDAKYNKKIVEDILKNQESFTKADESNEKMENNQPESQSKDANKNQKQPSPEGGKEANEEDNPPESGSQQQSASEQANGEQRNSEDKSPNQDNSGKPSNQHPMEDQEPGATTNPSRLSKEEQQAMEQWLRKVPDDPSELLKNKFEYYYQQQLRQQQRGQESLYLNNEERW